MAEFTYNPIQEVQVGQNVILNDSIRCPNGYVLHRQESGLVILRGIVNNPCGTFARYQVTFNGNIAIPNDGAVAPIAISLAIDGEAIPTSRAIFTPAAVDEYGNVTSTAIITVPMTVMVKKAWLWNLERPWIRLLQRKNVRQSSLA